MLFLDAMRQLRNSIWARSCNVGVNIWAILINYIMKMLCKKACNQILYPNSISTGNKICMRVLPWSFASSCHRYYVYNRTIPCDPEIQYTKCLLENKCWNLHIYKASNSIKIITRSPPDLNYFADHFGSIVAKPNFSAISNFESSTYGTKTKIDISGARAGQTRAPNQNFSTDMKSGPQNECHIKIWRFYV